MKEIEKKSWVDFSAVKLDVLKAVNSEGPMGEMNSWREAFPGVDFPDKMIFEEDGEEREVEINWDERTVQERMVFVALKGCSEAEVVYTITTKVRERGEYGDFEASFLVNQVICDCYRIWEMWADGCFCENDLSEEAIRDFVEFSIEGGRCKREYVDDADFDDIEISNVRVKIAI